MCASQSNILDDVQVSREGNQCLFAARLHWTVEVTDEQAPDQLQREVERMGQQVKRETYRQVLQEVEQKIAAQFQLANPALQRRGSRPYTLVAPFGKVQIQRTRTYDRQTRSWSVPAQRVWQTPRRHCLLPGLKEAVCDQVLDLSVRKTARALDEQADACKLICPATVVNVFHEQGRQWDQAQREHARAILQRHPQALECGLAGKRQDDALRAQSPDAGDAPGGGSAPGPQEASEAPVPELSRADLEEVRQRAVGFLGAAESSRSEPACAAPPSAVTEQAAAPAAPPDPGAGRAPGGRSRATRSGDDGWVVLQPDEVQTKAQARQPGKRNSTFTATIHAEGRAYYLAAPGEPALWLLVAAVLCRLGVLEGTRGLLVIGDGASWIRDWFATVHLLKQEMVLCWYHLTKRVYERLSQGGFSKARRQELERVVLGHLWRGELAQAVWILWGIRPEARHGAWITQLIHYLLARRDYLPNYSARHQARLWIASTRVEKWNDWAVSDRCKRRGMTWTAEGVLALALHQAQRRNDPALWESDYPLLEAA